MGDFSQSTICHFDLPPELLRLILVCICAPQDLHNIAAVSLAWKKETEAKRHACAQLGKAPWIMPNLKFLRLDINAIGDTGCAALATVLGALPPLEVLGLDYSQIGDAGLTSFATGLGKGALPNLKELLLNSNKIGDAGVISLSEAVCLAIGTLCLF